MNCHSTCNSYLNLRNKDHVNDEYLSNLTCPLINRLDLTNTKITYDGIRSLWNSNEIGKKRFEESEDRLYVIHHNLPVSIVNVEIAGTPALAQYNELKGQGTIIFPLPLRNFTISYPEGEIQGFKEINVTLYGKPF